MLSLYIVLLITDYADWFSTNSSSSSKTPQEKSVNHNQLLDFSANVQPNNIIFLAE